MEIEREHFRIEDVDQAIDGRVEAFLIEIFRKISYDRAFAVVGNAESVAEHAEHRLLGGHQVGLKDVLADGVTSVDFECFVNPGVLIGQGFLLDENRAKFAVSGERCDGGLVDVAVVGAEPIEHFSHKSGIDGGVEFVGFHGGEKLKSGSEVRVLPHGKAGDRFFNRFESLF